MANDRDPNFAEARPIEVNEPVPGRASTPVHVSYGPDRRPSGLGTVLASGALAFLLGGAGAWAYLNYLDPIVGKQRSEARQAKGQESQAGSPAPGTERAGGQSLRQARPAPGGRGSRRKDGGAPPDLEPLNKRISSLEDLPRKVEAMEARVGALPTKIDQEGRKITTLMADVEGVRTQLTSLRTEMPPKGVIEAAARSARPAAGAASEPPRQIAPPAGSSLQPGVDLFNQKKYNQAADFFLGLTRKNPDDARNWYYAALAKGLATRDWKGEVEKLVAEGAQREKAGTPERSEIDAAFSDLTSETGKDWLAFYRRGAH